MVSTGLKLTSCQHLPGLSGGTLSHPEGATELPRKQPRSETTSLRVYLSKRQTGRPQHLLRAVFGYGWVSTLLVR